jgi:hypothetical protein
MWVIPEDLGNFSPKKEKNLGEQKFARLSVSNFCGSCVNVLLKHCNLPRFRKKVACLLFPLQLNLLQL